MKQILLSILLTFIFSGIFCQTASTVKKELTCFEAYKKEFDERGSYPIEDGKYSGVIISLTTTEGTDCVYGKVLVEAGYVTTIWIQYDDNSYEFLDRKYKGSNKGKIVNGIAEPIVTTSGETIQVVFVDKIKPKKKQFKKANGPGANF